MRIKERWLLVKLLELFAAVKRKWPCEMDISAAKVFSDGGFLCWKQITIEEEISRTVNEDPSLVVAAIWPFHQALTKTSREHYVLGKYKVSKDDVKIEDFEKFLLAALHDESWSTEWEEFQKHN